MKYFRLETIRDLGWFSGHELIELGVFGEAIDEGCQSAAVAKQPAPRVGVDSGYPGIRIQLEAILGKVRTSMKIGFSTDDVITPHEVVFSLLLMFEERAIPLLAYISARSR